MRVFAKPFWAQRHGNEDSEYEDAFWPREPIDGLSMTSFRCAVADGATETSYSRIWAALLVRYWCRSACPATTFDGADLPKWQQSWSRIVRRRPLPWYGEEKVRQGAFAAILGLALDDVPNGSGGTWSAVAIGDSCLVQVRGDEVLARFPPLNSAAFSNRPHLLSSNPNYNSRVVNHAQKTQGTWQGDDAFYLMTDALACWFMREDEQRRTPWKVLRDLETCDEVKPFRELIEDLRKQGALRNDDVTLLRVEVS
jgi:hypothetical protein